MHGITPILLGLTAAERWEATRRLSPPTMPRQWFVLAGVVVMLVLLLVLIALSYRRQQHSRKPKVEDFGESATRRGLSVRERQILQAIALRSGLPHTQEIFRDLEAFNRGTVQLLAECARTRMPQEIDDLKAEVTRLRLKLGFQKASAGGALVPAHPGSRDIPVGKSIELTGRRDGQAIIVRAEVRRNDEIELAVALPTPLASTPGDSWLARCCAGISAWEFRTSTVSCNGTRLVLSHSDEIHVINRRRFPRVAVRAPALLAHWPFRRNGPVAGEAIPVGAPGAMAWCVPQFVESTVTELAGPGLRLETRLQVQVDDRVLIVFQGTQAAEDTPEAVAVVGRVRHGQDLARGTAIPDVIDHVLGGSAPRDFRASAAGTLSIAVELTGLSDKEIEELVSLTDRLFTRTKDNESRGAKESASTPTYEMTAP